MRIRKQLACTSECLTAPSPRTPLVSAVPIVAAEVLENPDEDDDKEMAGRVKNGFEAGEEADEGVEQKVKDKEGNNDEKGKARRKRETETEEAHTMTKCKKTDGKGWHCKRTAQLPNSLCSYHLAQLRSYRARGVESVSGGRGTCRKKSAAAIETCGGVSTYYYYYFILGSWWGKRRVPLDGNENSESSDEHNDKTDRGALADDDEDDDDDGSRRDGNGNFNYDDWRLHKKRGRKPVKARSLKSIL